MKIEKLEIRNFGKMQNRTLEFSDGIQLISGENEPVREVQELCSQLAAHGGRDLVPHQDPREPLRELQGLEALAAH